MKAARIILMFGTRALWQFGLLVLAPLGLTTAGVMISLKGFDSYSEGVTWEAYLMIACGVSPVTLGTRLLNSMGGHFLQSIAEDSKSLWRYFFSKKQRAKVTLVRGGEPPETLSVDEEENRG